ncbi:sensor histidine kinase YpdA [Ruminiclostridium hungatei]|uniref:Sensor histidine kinase YpdA n=1 Tax=Ruminiclostridium hungatei TaxID=48256 RepID=A0A1V4SJV5_RUMHU|nr:histidine kinase [Ruminiclostridium hungatei]OPX44182.1 sensor histidine kinase YpdA [Ruminiclostridium hungatei]
MGKIHRIIVCACLLLVSLFLLGSSMLWNSDDKKGSGNRVEKGVLSLDNWSGEGNKVIALDGQWEFYWNQLLSPEDFKGKSENIPLLTGYMEVPYQWSKKGADGTAFPIYGCATYRMIIKDFRYSGSLGIKKNNIRFSSRIYVNGAQLLQDGVPSKKPTNGQYSNIPQIGFFDHTGGDLEIIVQAANYEYINAGISVSIYLGTAPELLHRHQKDNLIEFGIFISILTIALIYLILFITARISGRKDFVFLTFALFCLFFALYNVLMNERTILTIINWSFSSAYRIKELCTSAAFITLILFFYQLKKGIVSSVGLKMICIIYGTNILVDLFASIRFYTQVQAVFSVINQLVLMILLLSVAVQYIKGEQRQEFEMLTLLFSVIFMNLYASDILLFTFSLKSDILFSKFSMVAFMVTLIFFLSIRFFETYWTMGQMSSHLDKAEIAFLRSQIKPHFLYNTLNSIAALCIDQPEQAGELTVKLADYLRSSFNFKDMEALVPIEKEIEILKTYINIEKIRFGERLQICYRIDRDIDMKIPPLILQPLVENAVRYGIMPRPEGGRIDVIICRKQATVLFCIKDNGVGMQQDKIREVFEKASGSDGIGLWNINSRLRLLYGECIHIDSKEGTGTAVYFEIPYSKA